jgi:hypothetical protein
MELAGEFPCLCMDRRVITEWSFGQVRPIVSNGTIREGDVWENGFSSPCTTTLFKATHH